MKRFCYIGLLVLVLLGCRKEGSLVFTPDTLTFQASLEQDPAVPGKITVRNFSYQSATAIPAGATLVVREKDNQYSFPLSDLSDDPSFFVNQDGVYNFALSIEGYRYTRDTTIRVTGFPDFMVLKRFTFKEHPFSAYLSDVDRINTLIYDVDGFNYHLSSTFNVSGFLDYTLTPKTYLELEAPRIKDPFAFRWGDGEYQVELIADQRFGNTYFRLGREGFAFTIKDLLFGDFPNLYIPVDVWPTSFEIPGQYGIEEGVTIYVEWLNTD